MQPTVDIRKSLGWRITPHARQQALERGVRTTRILECVAEPEMTYPSRSEQIWRRGPLAVVVAPKTLTVVTVLLAGETDWDDETARAAFAARA